MLFKMAGVSFNFEEHFCIDRMHLRSSKKKTVSNLAQGILFIDGIKKDMTSGVTFSFKDSFLGMEEQYDAILTDQNVSCMCVVSITFDTYDYCHSVWYIS